MSETPCEHCGLPVPHGLIRTEEQAQFCCQGCRLVYETIHSSGLGRYYELMERAGAEAVVGTPGKGFSTLDNPAFLDRYAATGDDGLARIDLYVDALHCAACVWLVERLPTVADGVVESRVEIGRRLVRVTWDPGRVSLSAVARALDTLGYSPQPFRGTRAHDLRRRENRRHLIRIGVAGACAGNVMLVAFALYGGMFSGMDPGQEAMFRWVSLALTVLALVWPGRVFLVGAVSSIRARVMHMDLPVAIALTVGTVHGAWNTLRGAGEIYFESITAVIFLLLVGRWVQSRQQHAAQDAIERLYQVTPSTARRIGPDGEIVEVPVEALEPGQRVELRAGDSAPADGRILEGTAAFDLSMLTGESRPVDRGSGDLIHAGAVDLTSRVVLQVEATGEGTRVGRLMAMVEQFARERPPVVRLADRVAHWFVVAVLSWAALTAALWWWLDPRVAVPNAIALLIVTCPCALGLATPLAVVAAVGRAARAGILIKGGETLERLAGSGRMILDKTGTLTRGRVRLVHWRGDDALKPLVRALEAQVAHPIALAFVEAFGEPGAEHPAAVARHSLGGGVEGRAGGHDLAVGSPSFVRQRAARVPAWADAEEVTLVKDGRTPVFVARDGRVEGVAGLADPVWADARESISRLRELGWCPEIVSGDHPGVVDSVGDELGIGPGARSGGVTPERKVEAVRTALEDGAVVMVGDGVNDSAALSVASVGVAVHGGAEASLAAADVFLSRPGLDSLVRLVNGSRRTMRVIRRNVGASLVYNLVTGGLAMAGVINPLVAAILMPLSSLTVVTLSYRSRTF